MRLARLVDPSCAEELREEARQERSKMVSWMDVNEDPQRYEGAGLNLNWGEYYVADDKMDSDEDETGDVSSCEEAEEIGEDELLQEELPIMMQDIFM